MTSCSKCNSTVSRNEVSIQYNTCKHVLHNMKCSNLNTESLDFMKSKGKVFNCEDYKKKLKQDRGERTPIKSIPQTKGDANIYMNSE